MKFLRSFFGSFAWALLIGGAAACGDVYADPDGPSMSLDPPDAVFFDAGVDTTSQQPQANCPTSRPRENSACSEPGSTCEFGTGADRECNDVLSCTSANVTGTNVRGAWIMRPADPCFESACPAGADVASLEGKPCSLVDDGDADGGTVTDSDEAVCDVSDGICACTTGRDGTTKHDRMWICVRPISACPTNRPRLGATCSGGLWCDYGSCKFKRGMVMECINGLWLNGGATCQ